jgi:hypothetical protein
LENVAELKSAKLEIVTKWKLVSPEKVAELEARLENFAPKNEVRPENVAELNIASENVAQWK